MLVLSEYSFFQVIGASAIGYMIGRVLWHISAWGAQKIGRK